jgi:hypothetical protein
MLPGPLIAAPAAKPYDIAGPAAQNHEVTIQHALAGPSGTQAQTDYANVSIISYLSISSIVFNPNINLSLCDISKCNFCKETTLFSVASHIVLDTIETQNTIFSNLYYFLCCYHIYFRYL